MFFHKTVQYRIYLFLYLFGSQKQENIQFHKGKKLYEKWIEIWITFWPEWAKRTRARKLFISRSISNKVFFLYEIVYFPNLRSKQVERQFYDMIKIYSNTHRAKLALSVNVNGGEGEGKEELMKHTTYLDCDFFYRLKKLLYDILCYIFNFPKSSIFF